MTETPTNDVLVERIANLTEKQASNQERTIAAIAEMKAANEKDHLAVREFIGVELGKIHDQIASGMDVYERKETIRPFKRAVYGLWGLGTAGAITAIINWASGKA